MSTPEVAASPSVPKPRRRKRLWIGGTLLALILVAAASYFYVKISGDRELPARDC